MNVLYGTLGICVEIWARTFEVSVSLHSRFLRYVFFLLTLYYDFPQAHELCRVELEGVLKCSVIRGGEGKNKTLFQGNISAVL
jgi:hypothetical protein